VLTAWPVAPNTSDSGGFFADGQSFVVPADERILADYECAEMIMGHWFDDNHSPLSGEPLIVFDPRGERLFALRLAAIKKHL
jgi:hypothetical protein